MAIYHLSAKVIGRSSGRTSTAAAAYRAGERIEDPRTGLVFDYRRRRYVGHKEILLPAGAPAWAGNRALLWQAVEAVEVRRDAQLCRELQIALPHELSQREQTKLIQEFLRRCFVSKGMTCDLCIHHNPGNVHAHVLVTMRELRPEGFSGKCRKWNQKQMLDWWRQSWSRSVNSALARKGLAERIDHRTLDAQVSAINKQIKEEEVTMTTTNHATGEIGAPIELQTYKPVGLTLPRAICEMIASDDEAILEEDFAQRSFFEYLQAATRRLFKKALVKLKRDSEADQKAYQVILDDCIKLTVSRNKITASTGSPAELAAMARLCKEFGWTRVRLKGTYAFRQAAYAALLAVGYEPEDIFGKDMEEIDEKPVKRRFPWSSRGGRK